MLEPLYNTNDQNASRVQGSVCIARVAAQTLNGGVSVDTGYLSIRSLASLLGLIHMTRSVGAATMNMVTSFSLDGVNAHHSVTEVIAKDVAFPFTILDPIAPFVKFTFTNNDGVNSCVLNYNIRGK